MAAHLVSFHFPSHAPAATFDNRPVRQAPGGRPRCFLDARLNAASDLYPTFAPACAMLTVDLTDRRAASCMRHRPR